MSTPEVESARQQWQAGERRLEQLRGEPRLYHRLRDQAGAVVDELRRRVGQTYTLADLARAYQGADAWILGVLEDADPDPGWERNASLVLDAAFHLYARGAADYRP